MIILILINLIKNKYYKVNWTINLKMTGHITNKCYIFSFKMFRILICFILLKNNKEFNFIRKKINNQKAGEIVKILILVFCNCFL